MRTLGQIKRMLEKSEAGYFWRMKREIKELQKIIGDNEVITYAILGYYENYIWLIVSTNKRIIFLNKGIFFKLAEFEIPLNKIVSINYKKNLLFGEIEILWNRIKIVRITNIFVKRINPFEKAVNKAKEKFEKARLISAVDELIKLKYLLDQRAITPKEFEKKKKELLDED